MKTLQNRPKKEPRTFSNFPVGVVFGKSLCPLNNNLLCYYTTILSEKSFKYEITLISFAKLQQNDLRKHRVALYAVVDQSQKRVVEDEFFGAQDEFQRQREIMMIRFINMCESDFSLSLISKC